MSLSAEGVNADAARLVRHSALNEAGEGAVQSTPRNNFRVSIPRVNRLLRMLHLAEAVVIAFPIEYLRPIRKCDQELDSIYLSSSGQSGWFCQCDFMNEGCSFKTPYTREIVGKDSIATPNFSAFHRAGTKQTSAKVMVSPQQYRPAVLLTTISKASRPLSVKNLAHSKRSAPEDSARFMGVSLVGG